MQLLHFLQVPLYRRKNVRSLQEGRPFGRPSCWLSIPMEGVALVAEGVVRLALVVELPPASDKGLVLGKRAKPLPVEQLVGRLAVETLYLAVLQGLPDTINAGSMGRTR